MPASVLRDGDLVNAKFRVIGDKPIGAGQFAEVFKAEVVDRPRGAGGGGGSKGVGTGQLVAIKIEREEKTTTRELRALTDLAGCPGICQVLGSGLHKDKHPYIVMQLGGTNLFDVRHKFAPGERTHSKGTISWIGCRVLDTLRSVHEQGYVHRDVKPSNVTVGGGGNDPGGSNGAGASSSGRELLLIDLGLAKKFQTKEDAVASHLANSQEKGHSEPPRGPFRGSTTYASINAHAGTEQGPRDDLWSLLYLLAEAHEGTLPWRSLKTETDDESVKHQTKLAKEQCIARPDLLCPLNRTPSHLVEFSRHLERVENAHDMPDYGKLRRILEAMDDRGLDWEIDGKSGSNNGSHVKREEHGVKLEGGKTSYKDVAAGAGSNPSKPEPPMNAVRTILDHPETVPVVVKKWVQKIGEELDVSHASAVIAGICASAISQQTNHDDELMTDWVLDIFDQAAQAGKDARAYVEERGRKRKASGV